MRKVIAFIDGQQNLMDKNKAIICNLAGQAYAFEDAGEKAEKAEKAEDIAQLISLGVTPDDLIKLKANGLI